MNSSPLSFLLSDKNLILKPKDCSVKVSLSLFIPMLPHSLPRWSLWACCLLLLKALLPPNAWVFSNPTPQDSHICVLSSTHHSHPRCTHLIIQAPSYDPGVSTCSWFFWPTNHKFMGFPPPPLQNPQFIIKDRWPQTDHQFIPDRQDLLRSQTTKNLDRQSSMGKSQWLFSHFSRNLRSPNRSLLSGGRYLRLEGSAQTPSPLSFIESGSVCVLTLSNLV